MVTDSDICEIYSYRCAQVRSTEARKLLEHISKNNPTEPFAVRWLSHLVDSKFGLYACNIRACPGWCHEPHPTLVEISERPVAQAEAQLLVTKEGCEIITRAKLIAMFIHKVLPIQIHLR